MSWKGLSAWYPPMGHKAVDKNKNLFYFLFRMDLRSNWYLQSFILFRWIFHRCLWWCSDCFACSWQISQISNSQTTNTIWPMWNAKFAKCKYWFSIAFLLVLFNTPFFLKQEQQISKCNGTTVIAECYSDNVLKDPVKPNHV